MNFARSTMKSVCCAVIVAERYWMRRPIKMVNQCHFIDDVPAKLLFSLPNFMAEVQPNTKRKTSWLYS